MAATSSWSRARAEASASASLASDQRQAATRWRPSGSERCSALAQYAGTCTGRGLQVGLRGELAGDAGAHEHLARLHAVGRADEPLALHPLDDLGGLVVAEPHLALELGDRDLVHPGHELDRLVV